MATKGKAAKEQRKGAGRGQHPNSRANLRQNAFQPGESGNPAGLPPGTRQRGTILKKWLEVARDIDAKRNPTGEAVKGTVEDEIMLALIAKAAKVDVAAIREIQDSMYGKAAQPVTGADGGPIRIKSEKDLSDDELAAIAAGHK